MSIGVDDLLSGAVGALLVALITVAYTEVRESRRRIEGAAGLARLLLYEVCGNNEGELVKPEPAPGSKMKGAVPSERLWVSTYLPPNVDAWKDSRAQLSQLIGKKDFAAVASYYAPLLALAEACASPRSSGSSVSTLVPRRDMVWASQTEEVQSILRRYADRTHWWPRLFRLD